MTSQLDFLGWAPVSEGPSPDGVAASLTEDTEKPRLNTLGVATGGAPPFSPPPRTIDPWPGVVDARDWRRLEVRPPDPVSFVSCN